MKTTSLAVAAAEKEGEGAPGKRQKVDLQRNGK
jgi:hypothetical protein